MAEADKALTFPIAREEQLLGSFGQCSACIIWLARKPRLEVCAGAAEGFGHPGMQPDVKTASIKPHLSGMMSHDRRDGCEAALDDLAIGC